MDALLLTTKLFMPPVPRDWGYKPRLLEQLRSGLSIHLTVILAPDGYGKTTLTAPYATVGALSGSNHDHSPIHPGSRTRGSL